MLGAVMLKAWGIADATSTSVLAVGLIAVVSLLLLIDVLTSTWMLLVIPLVGAATYALSHAVTAAFARARAGLSRAGRPHLVRGGRRPARRSARR